MEKTVINEKRTLEGAWFGLLVEFKSDLQEKPSRCGKVSIFTKGPVRAKNIEGATPIYSTLFYQDKGKIEKMVEDYIKANFIIK